jgi:cupin 2 domain-containing protein
MICESLFSSLPTNLPQELTEVLAENKHVRIEKIISHGHASPDGFRYWDEVPRERLSNLSASTCTGLSLS